MQQLTTGVTDRAVLGRLLQGGFVGTAAELAEEVHCQERYVWVSVAGLAERGLISAQRNAAGGLRMKITVTGRLAHSANQLKYAPTAKERKQGRVSFSA